MKNFHPNLLPSNLENRLLILIHLNSVRLRRFKIAIYSDFQLLTDTPNFGNTNLRLAYFSNYFTIGATYLY
ncbi:MAG: hypothetical protein LBB88_06760 [Planctomycetaceae bacterium]|nr:hypothetical protein [Planctomycetaceae bacterium]